MTGFGVVASALGLPDAGLATYTELLNRAERMAEFSRAPIIADAATSYAHLLKVRHTVRDSKKAGVAVIQLEAQVFLKKAAIRQAGVASQRLIWSARSRSPPMHEPRQIS